MRLKLLLKQKLKKMTDLDVIEVNVNVVDIKTKEQHEADNVTLQDKVTDAAHATSQFTSKQIGNVKSATDNAVSTEPRVQ